MGQILEDGQRLPDYLVGFITLNIDHKTNAAGVMLKTGIVESLFYRRA
jgi:hypothetical protein